MLSLSGFFGRTRSVSAIAGQTPLTLDGLSTQEREWFYFYRRDRVGVMSPQQVRARMESLFGTSRALELVLLYERTAIPARPGEWRRRMH